VKENDRILTDMTMTQHRTRKFNSFLWKLEDYTLMSIICVYLIYGQMHR